MCSIDEDIYLMRCPLICFYAVEYHLPHRVARQFGLRQEFPVEPFSTSIELHKFDRQRQKKVTDFETHHRDYIDEWNQQGDLNYENDQAHTNYNFRRYLIWYSGVTRCKLKGQWTAADYVKKVLVDGGSSINVTIPRTLQALGVAIHDLTESDTPFFGIVLTKGEYPLEHIYMSVTFGTPENYRTEFLRFEVARFDCGYNAIIGRPG
eukprot:XP_020398624.1 serine/threonine-protein phosphatase 7 long form homolog [Zea mays]